MGIIDFIKGNKIKFSLTIIYVLFLLSPIIFINIININLNDGISLFGGRTYDLTGTGVIVNISNDGLVRIHEDIGYNFKGCYHEVYRTLNIYDKQRTFIYFKELKTPYLKSMNASCRPDCSVDDRSYEIAGSFGDICDRDANFYIDYEVINGVTVGSDVTEFHYKIWGEDWDQTLKQLSGQIILPDNVDMGSVDVYFNPIGTVDEYHFNNNIIYFSGKNIDHYLEVRLLFPQHQFISEENIVVNPALKKSDIEFIQNSYSLKYHFFKILGYILIILFLILVCYLPYVLFKKYGAEPKIDYDAIYEREPIKGIKPYFISSLSMGKVGDTNLHAISATILDLIRRKHIVLSETMIKSGIFRTNKKAVQLHFTLNQKDQLSEPEQCVYSFFKSNTDSKDNLVWTLFQKKLSKESDAKRYIEFTKDFERKVDNSYDLKKYFDKTGNQKFKLYCGFFILVNIICIIFYYYLNQSTNYPYSSSFIFVFGNLIILSILGLFLPDKIFGRFSSEGFEIYQKSIKFKKFLNDMTLLKEYPPESIVMWEEYLIYATLFGVATKVIKQFELNVNEPVAKSSSLFLFYNTSSIRSLSSSSSTARSTISRSSRGGGGFSGGGGGIGGGFGGGGGGAR